MSEIQDLLPPLYSEDFADDLKAGNGGQFAIDVADAAAVLPSRATEGRAYLRCYDTGPILSEILAEHNQNLHDQLGILLDGMRRQPRRRAS